MKRRRSSPRSSPLIGNGPYKERNESPTTTKVQRASAEPGETHADDMPFHPQTGALKCSLPPTCSRIGKERFFSNVTDMERHHATYHTHTCLDAGCGKVFPDARFLTLHQAECHDPLTEIRKERGEKTFQCFLDSCSRKFMAPKARRHHLIQVHGYPAEFFFAITNKGMGGLLERWGEGASLIRGKWKDKSSGASDVSMREHVDDTMSTTDCEESPDRKSGNQPSLSPTPLKATTRTPGAITNQEANRKSPLQQKPEASSNCGSGEDPLESLTCNMTALSLVPRVVHFGRAKVAGLGHR